MSSRSSHLRGRHSAPHTPQLSDSGLLSSQGGVESSSLLQQQQLLQSQLLLLQLQSQAQSVSSLVTILLHWYLSIFIESAIGRLRAPAAPAVGLWSHGYPDTSALSWGIRSLCGVSHRTGPLLRYRRLSPSPLSGVLSVPTGVQLGVPGPSLPHPSAAGVEEQSPHGYLPLSQSNQREPSR